MKKLSIKLNILILALALSTNKIYPKDQGGEGVPGNPAAVNIELGTGALGRALGIKKSSGLKLGGLWIPDASNLLKGGDPQYDKFTGNNLLILECTINTEKAFNWKGGLFGIEYLQFNGQPTNFWAGVVQGFDNLSVIPPFSRSELYGLWYRQSIYDDKVVIRAGKSIPTYDFNNVFRPIPLEEEHLMIGSVSGLTYTPIYINTSMLGVIPGYYNSAWGITTTVSPVKQAYISFGIYDGNLANGVQTGMKVGPTINEYSFSIFEIGKSWLMGPQKKPGTIAIGAWHQSGVLKLETLDKKTVYQDGTLGFYLFGSQLIWFKNPGKNSDGISVFFQFGRNNSKTLPMSLFVGAGLTCFGLTKCRKDDSFGFGVAWSTLNPLSFTRSTELMLQGYYQAQIIKSSFLVTSLTYIPHPGAAVNNEPLVAITGRIVALF